MSEKRKVLFGIVGTGVIASFHAEALALSDKAQLAVVYDAVPERAEAFAAKYNCRAAKTFEDFLASEVEAVSITTPTGLHGDVAIPCAKAGKHVLCEKPLDVTLERADAIIDACEENGVLLSAIFQSRYNRAIQQIKKAADEGRFGVVTTANCQVHWYRSPEYYASAGWRGTWKFDGGGALMNQGIHTLDLLLYVNGDVEEVHAWTANRLHKSIEVEDSVVASLKFKNGSLGTLEASTACYPGFPRRVEIYGGNGSAVLEDDRLAVWSFSNETAEDDEIRRLCSEGEGLKGGSANPTAISCEGHRRQINEFAESILTGKPLSIPGKEGRRAIALIMAIYESARTGKVVKL